MEKARHIFGRAKRRQGRTARFVFGGADDKNAAGLGAIDNGQAEIGEPGRDRADIVSGAKATRAVGPAKPSVAPVAVWNEPEDTCCWPE